MKVKSRKVFAILVVAAMILAMLPVGAFAESKGFEVTKIENSPLLGRTEIRVTFTVDVDDLSAYTVKVAGEDFAIASSGDYFLGVFYSNSDIAKMSIAELEAATVITPALPVIDDPTPPVGNTPVLGVTRVAADPIELQVGETSEFTLTFYGTDGKAFAPNGSFSFYIRSNRAAEKIEPLAAADQKGSFTSASSDLAAGKGTKVTVNSLTNGQLTLGIKSAFAGKAAISFWDDEAGEDDSNKFAESTLTYTAKKVDKAASSFTANYTGLQIFKELELKAVIMNKNDVPVEGETVTFQKSFEGGIWTTIATKDTNAIGVATIKTTESEAGDYEYRARVGNDTMGTAVAVKWTGTAPTKIEALTDDGSIAVDVEQKIDFVVKDAFDNVVAGQKVKLELDSRPSGATAFSATEEVTNKDGEVTFEFKPSREGTYKVKASLVGTGLKSIVTLNAAPFGAVDHVRIRLAKDRVSIKSYDSGSGAVAGIGNAMTMRVDLWDVNDVRSTVNAEDIRLSTSSTALATINGLTVNANGKERRGVVTITATHLDSGKSASIDLPVVGGAAAIENEISISNYTADVKLQLVDADGNATWAGDLADTRFSVVGPTDMVISQRKAFKKMEGNGSFRAVVEAAGTYTVTVVADNGLASTFDIVYGEPASEVDGPEYGAANVTMFIGSTGYVVDGAGANVDVAPFIEDGRTFVPVRFIAEALGAEADWEPKDAAVEVVTLVRPDKTITIKIGEYALEVEEDEEVATVTMDTVAMIKDGRTFLPFRYIAEAFGADVEYGPEDGPVEWVSFTQ